MNTEQNIINKDKDNNNNSSQSNNFLSQLKSQINYFENKEKLPQKINNEENSQKEKDVFKTNNKEEEEEQNLEIIKEDDATNKTNNLNIEQINTQLTNESLFNNKNNNANKINEDEVKINKTEAKVNENQGSIPTQNKKDDNTILIEKNKEADKIITENIINIEDSNNNKEKANNNLELGNNIDINKNDNIQKFYDKTNNNMENNNPEIINTNINIKTEQKEQIHKPSFSCLNKCFHWIINLEIKTKEENKPIPEGFKTQYTLKGTSIFNKILDKSLLNLLNTSLNSNNDKTFQSLLNSIKAESNKIIEIISQNPLEKGSTLKDLLNYNYPIDNTKTNCLFINSNLSLKENLVNLFLIEIDLDQIKEENNNQEDSDFRKINDFCVDREIDFKLNGFLHGKKIFKNDLIFSAGYGYIIKSIQMQIRNLKNNNNMQNVIFSKVLVNANIGLEFFVPSFNENTQTNFNAVVNSQIGIKKIFLELTIPNNAIGNKSNTSNAFEGITEDSNSFSTKRTEINSPKKEEINISISNSNHTSNKNLNYNMNINPNPNMNVNLIANMKNYLFNNNIPTSNPPNIGFNRSIPASPHLPPNQFNMYQQQKYSPLINNNYNNNNMIYNYVQNNLRPMPNQNSFYGGIPNYYLSPAPRQPQQIFCSPQPQPNMNICSPLSANLMMMQGPPMGRFMQQQPLSVNSPLNTSNYSSPYLGPNINRNTVSFNSSNNRKYSESFQNENQINNMMRNVNNSNNHTPLIMRGLEEEFINQFMSPKSMGPATSFNLGNMNMINLNMNRMNGSLYELNPMNNMNQRKQQINQIGNISQMGSAIPMTIRQKIAEKTKKDQVEKINIFLNSSRIRQNNNMINNNNLNINNMNNINNINNMNNFNNISANNIIRTNIMKNNLLSNVNIGNPNNISSFNNINQMKNIANIHNIQNNQNIQNMINTGNNINMKNNIINMNRAGFNKDYQMNVNYEKGEINEKQKIKNMFIQENQNKSNLDLFLKTVTPVIKISKNDDYLKLKLQTIFENIKLISLLGLKTIYFNNGELLDLWYSLSLSSLSIKLYNKQLITQIFQEIKNKRKDLENLILHQTEEIKISESLFSLYFTTEYLEISYTEKKPEYFRKSYNSIIKSLKNSIPLFSNITLEDIDLINSYYALLLTSVKILQPFTPHSFVVYYNFNNENSENKTGNNQIKEKYVKQNIIGLLPIKVSEEFFRQKITSPKQNRIYKKFSIFTFLFFSK